jgi:hypothetical protein
MTPVEVVGEPARSAAFLRQAVDNPYEEAAHETADAEDA